MAELLRVVGNQGNPVNPLTLELLNHLLDAESTINGLPARHGYGIVVEDLVGNVDAGCQSLPYRQQTGMEIGTVSQVLKNMFGLGEWRLPDPGNTFTTHLGKCFRLPITSLKNAHVVTTNTAHGATAFRDACRRTVRTTRTIMR